MKTRLQTLSAASSLALRSPAILFAALMLPLIWAVLFANLFSERETALQQAKLHTNNVAQIFQENTERIFLGVDRSLRTLRLLYETDPQFDLKYWAENASLIAGNAIQFALIGSDGYMINTTAGYQGARLYLGDREHFVRVAALERDDLYVATPVIGRASGKWSIQIARKLRTRDGSFAGVIVGSIDPEEIGRFFETAQLGGNGSVVLRNFNHVILAARGISAPAIARIAKTPPLEAALKQAPEGFYWGGGAVDGINRLVAYRVSDSLPLIFTVGEAEDEIFSAFWHHREIYFSLAILLTIILMIAAYFDIQRRLVQQRSETELASVKHFLDTILQSVPIPIAIKDVATRNFILINRAFERFLGNAPQKILGTNVFDHFTAEVAAKISNFDSEALKLSDRSLNSEFALETKGGEKRVVTTTRTAVRDSNQNAQFLLTVIEDITERKRSEAKIERLAHFDALTSLANRNLFRERTEEFLGRLRRLGIEFAVFLLDLDNFKTVNDSFGHQTGDTLLQEVASRIAASIRDVDVAARLGGDEFALLVAPGKDTLSEGVARLAERLVAIVSEPYEIAGQRINVGCSIGIALAPEHGRSGDELLKNADLALYNSKDSGRSCFSIYSDKLKSDADGRNELENDLRQAVWHEEFELYYQPVVAIQTGRIAAMEALVRWRHPTKGLVAPDRFIPLAEQAGLIIQLGEWVLAKACHDATRMPDDIKVAVNLSPVQFSKSNLVDAVIFALVDSQLPPERLELEITEGVLLKETDQNREVLRQLQNLGVSIALDDFGVGYASLSYLTSFPFDKVKIDGSFVQKLDRPETKAVVTSIASLSRTLDLKACAEGIETKEQLADLRSLGIDLGQGYYFGAPSPLAELSFDCFATGEHKAA